MWDIVWTSMAIAGMSFLACFLVLAVIVGCMLIHDRWIDRQARR